MNAYKYDATTKEYIAIVSAQIDPIQTAKQGREVFLLPADATFSVPPVRENGKAVVFHDGQWEQVSDLRGQLAYDEKGVFRINYIGDLRKGNQLLSQEQIKGLDEGSLVFLNGQIVPKPEPTIQEQIESLESQITNRNIRCALLGDQYAIDKITEIENLIANLREKIPVQGGEE